MGEVRCVMIVMKIASGDLYVAEYEAIKCGTESVMIITLRTDYTVRNNMELLRVFTIVQYNTSIK